MDIKTQTAPKIEPTLGVDVGAALPARGDIIEATSFLRVADEAQSPAVARADDANMTAHVSPAPTSESSSAKTYDIDRGWQMLWPRIMSVGHTICARLDDVSWWESFAPKRIKMSLLVSFAAVLTSIVLLVAAQIGVAKIVTGMASDTAYRDPEPVYAAMDKSLRESLAKTTNPVIQPADALPLVREIEGQLKSTGNLTSDAKTWKPGEPFATNGYNSLGVDGKNVFLAVVLRNDTNPAAPMMLWFGLAHKYANGWQIRNVPTPVSASIRQIDSIKFREIPNTLEKAFLPGDQK
jgi:hypothetical protein